MILDIYKDAIEYSFQDKKGLIKFGVFYLFNILILPIFLELGYSYRVTKIAVHGMINGGEKFPDLNDVISMFVDGIKVFFVKFLYLLIPTAIFLVLTYISMINGMFSSYIGGIIAIIGILIFIVSGVICFILSDLSIAHMAAGDETLSSALDIKRIWEISKSIGWLKLVGFYIGLFIITSAIILIFAFIIGSIYGMFSVSSGVLGINMGVMGGLNTILLIIVCLILILFIYPLLTIFQARSIGLIYNLQ